MLKHSSVLTAAMAAFMVIPMSATANNSSDLAEIRAQIKQMKENYESRIQSLEQRLQEAQARQDVRTSPPVAQADPPEKPVAVAAAANAANAFNPAISLTLGGTYANLSKDPGQYRLQGFMPGGEIGPGRRGFNLGESELTLSASVDHRFSGQLTFALAPDNSASVEEAFFQAKGLADGVNLKGGRFLSSVGYLNNQHAHTWDFVDAPLAYQAFFGGQYRQDGAQLKWIAPTERFIELGFEAGNGDSFPGTSRNKNGANSLAVFAHAGGDIGASSSWRAGISYLRTHAVDRSYDDVNALGDSISNTFSGKSGIWIVDGVYKWAPNGNTGDTSFKLQGEYFRRKESGTLSQADDTGSYRATQSGWYAQGVYQFMRNWRAGVRYDRLSSGTQDIGLDAANFPALASYSPRRTSLMLDYSPSEFSRIRLQIARDQTRPGVTDNQIFLQYIMSLGAHGAHAF